LLCSAPLRALDVVTQQGPGLSEIAFIHALLRQSMIRSARDYHVSLTRGHCSARPQVPTRGSPDRRRGDRVKRREFITLLGGAGMKVLYD